MPWTISVLILKTSLKNFFKKKLCAADEIVTEGSRQVPCYDGELATAPSGAYTCDLCQTIVGSNAAFRQVRDAYTQLG